MATHAMIEHAAAIAPMERLLRDELCCDWSVSVPIVVGWLRVSATVTVCSWPVKFCEDDCM